MKDYKVLLGWASILFAVGFVIRSVAIAYASPYGPNVSMGSNPLVVLAGQVGSDDGDKVILSVPSNKRFIMTDIEILNKGSYNHNVYLKEDGSQRAYWYLGSTSFFTISKTSGIPFEPNTDITLSTNISQAYAFHYTITGYYTHP